MKLMIKTLSTGGFYLNNGRTKKPEGMKTIEEHVY